MPKIDLSSKRLVYKFEIEGKYSVIKGDSASGKTTFYDLVLNLQSNNGIQNKCSHKIVAMPMNYDDFRIENYTDTIIVVDENCTLFRKKNFAQIVNASENYFIFLTRTMHMDALTISVDSVYQFKNSGKYHQLIPYYAREKTLDIQKLDTIIMEDSNSGYKFVNDMLSAFDIESSITILSAKGKSKICNTIECQIKQGSKDILIFYDASAFGIEKDKLETLISRYATNKNTNYSFTIIDWESFEHYILSTKVYNIFLKQSDYGCKYISLERYAEQFIKKVITNYNKTSLNLCLRRNRCRNTCNNKYQCSYCNTNYLDLICYKVAVLYNYVEQHYKRQKVDISYIKFYAYNKHIQREKIKPCYRIDSVNLRDNTCNIEDISRTLDIIDVVQQVQKNNCCLSNASILKDWIGWTQ